MKIGLSRTPIEEHELLDGSRVFVKREDSCWPYPATSKARGVYRAVLRRPEAAGFAAADTGRSYNGLLVGTICLHLKRPVVAGYPVYKATPEALTGTAVACRSLGIPLFKLKANRQFVMRSELEKKLPPDWFVFPTGLRLPETVEAVSEEMMAVLESGFEPGTVVVPSGTGTHCAGIVRAFGGNVVAVQGYDRPEATFRSDVERAAGVVAGLRLRIVRSVLGYFEVRSDRLPPFPANPYYEVKAWKWLNTPGVYKALAKPVLFWNIGT